MLFSQVIGQKDIKEHLMHMVQHNRLSHALLFLGKEGSGALSLARALAQYTVCEKVSGKKIVVQEQSTIEAPSLFGDPEPSATPLAETENNNLETIHDACGECASCQKAAKLIHPDIHFSFPVITKKQGEKPISTYFIS